MPCATGQVPGSASPGGGNGQNGQNGQNSQNGQNGQNSQNGQNGQNGQGSGMSQRLTIGVLAVGAGVAYALSRGGN